MEKCPYCQKPVEEGDTVCTSCWKSLPKKNTKPFYARLGVVGWFVVIMLAALVIFGSMLVKQEITNAQVRAEQTRNAPIPTVKVSTGDRITAFDVCKQFVSDRLKAPASAKFSNQFSESTVTEYQSGKWEITAYVDAQNSFGAQIRTNYTCKLQFISGVEYKLIELTTK